MASALILGIQTVADKRGLDQISQGLEQVKQKAQAASVQSADLGNNLARIGQVLAGTVMTLPLTGFIKEAIESEEITARFNMQAQALGVSLRNLDIEGLSKRTDLYFY